MIRLRLLGETAIDIDGTPVGPDSQVIFAVLLVLSLERGKRLGRTALHRLLWPAADDESGRHNLRQVAYKLRQLGVPLDATQSSLMLPASAVEGELVELLSGTGAVGARLLAGRRVGELLPGYAPSFSAPFADWVDEQRGLLQSGLRRALLSAMAEARSAGRWREVEAIAREVLRFDPLNEEATLALAEATALAGSKAQAIDIIDRYLGEVGGRPGDLQISASVLRRRIAERMPVHRYASAADRCFVGRTNELAELLQVWYSARDGRGGGALLYGEAGIGKTRLALELGQIVALQGARVVKHVCRSWDTERQFRAIMSIVPSIRELPGAAGVDPQCNEFLDRLTKQSPEQADLDPDDVSSVNQRIRQAVFDLIDAVQAESPLALIFDDVQWLDSGSLEVIAELLRSAGTQRLLLIMTSRTQVLFGDDTIDAWELLYRRHLGSIDAAASCELMDAITREAGRYMSPDHREWCVPLAGGNPLYLQELALQWLDNGGRRETPIAIRTMIEARIDRLSSNALLLLTQCALLGRGARVDWIARTGVLSLKEALEGATELVRSHLAIGDEEQLVVRHPVITEIVASKTDQITRSTLHRQIAIALEESATALDAAALLWEAADHWSRTGRDRLAFDALVRCARHLIRIGLAKEAVATLELAERAATDADARTTITLEMAFVLALDHQWTRVRELLVDLPLPASHTPAAPWGAAMLKLFEARWKQHEPLTPLISDCLAIARSAAYTREWRARAATLALILTDNRDGDATEYVAVGQELGNLLSHPDVPPAERHRHRMVLRALQLNPTESAEEARALLRTTSEDEEASAILTHRHVAQAFRAAGWISDAERALHTAISIADRLKLRVPLLESIAALVLLSLYSEDTAATAYWLAKSESIAAPSQDPIAAHSTAYIRFQAAAATGDVATMQKLHDTLADPRSAPDNERMQLAALSSKVRLAAECSSKLTADERRDLEVLLGLTRRNLRRGLVDFPVSACLRGLLRLGRVDDASVLSRNFVGGARYERCPLHSDLRAVLAHNPSLLLQDA